MTTIDEKIKARIEKLRALAERGIGGEKTTAAKKLQELLDKNGISLDDLVEDKEQYYIFSYHTKYESKLLCQCIYKVKGYKNYPEFYVPRGRRQKVGTYCTSAQKIEIELEFEFYKKVFYEELEDFISAFINKQGIYPNDVPVKEVDTFELTPEELQRAIKQQAYEDGIEKRTRVMMIEKN